MKEFLLFLPLTIAYLALKSTVLAGFPLPDIPLIIVFYMAHRKAAVDGLLAAFALGYLDDAMSGGVLGSSSFSLVLIFVAVHLLSKIVQFTTPAVKGGGVFAASVLKGALAYYILRAAGLDALFQAGMVLEAAVSGLLAPAVFALLQKTVDIATPRKFKDNEN
ncbi:MAG: rod shape-determining protein MreD [Deltaproteobacteria bacterium]|nr:rod shape-determining protein MreD [Deltaproteobacteria bacterium]MBZ0218870.1 rod shape-determining protein MreD [Deltaproteobacteria bacterium]